MAEPASQEKVRDDKGRFVKGVSGNPQGMPSGTVSLKRLFIAKLQEAIKTPGAFQGKPYSEAVIHTWLEAIIKGEPWALKLALAYVDGLPVQAVELTGKDGKDLIPDAGAALEAKLDGIASAIRETGDPGATE